jgi:ABC-type amino acid transport substrate-binding protein
MSVKCTWVGSDFDALIPSLKAKKIDAIISSLSLQEAHVSGDVIACVFLIKFVTSQINGANISRLVEDIQCRRITALIVCVIKR